MIDILTVSLTIFFCTLIITTIQYVCDGLNDFFVRLYFSFVVGFCASGIMFIIVTIVTAIK